MGTIVTTTRGSTATGDYGNSSVFVDSIAVPTTSLTAASVIKLTRVPAGTLVDRVVVKNTDMDSNATPTSTAKIGFSPVDGSAAVAGADTAILSTAAFGQAAATTTYEIFPPYAVEVDSYVTIVIGTGAATAAAGTVYAKVEGEYRGVK